MCATHTRLSPVAWGGGVVITDDSKEVKNENKTDVLGSEILD
jgi:hypothetical protein